MEPVPPSDRCCNRNVKVIAQHPHVLMTAQCVELVKSGGFNLFYSTAIKIIGGIKLFEDLFAHRLNLCGEMKNTLAKLALLFGLDNLHVSNRDGPCRRVRVHTESRHV